VPLGPFIMSSSLMAVTLCGTLYGLVPKCFVCASVSPSSQAVGQTSEPFG